MTSIAAIVPAYNEAQTIADVVATLRQSVLVQEVIVVSDGSTDDTEALAASAGARVIRLSKKGGKGAAMLHGLTQTDAQIILFTDADLIGFTTEHVERLLLPILNGARVMNVGLRDRGRLITALGRFLPLIGGERAIRRSVIEQIPPHFLQGFMIESALNYFCRSRRLAYGSVALPGLTIRRKYQKVGWKEGFKQYARMSGQIVTAMVRVRIAHLTGTFHV